MFEAFNDFFDKVYVITLHRAVERQQLIEQELKGLNYTFMFGADKNELDIETLKKSGQFDILLAKKHHTAGKIMLPGQLACSISHRMVYEDVIRNNYGKVLILEDDIVVDKRNLLSFKETVKELPADWGLWYLGFDKNENAPANSALKKVFYHFLYSIGLKPNYNHTVINNLYPKGFSTHLKVAGFHDCAHAYAITKNTAGILLKMQTPVSYIADHLLAYAVTNALFKSFISVPTLINQQYQVSAKPVQSYINS